MGKKHAIFIAGDCGEVWNGMERYGVVWNGMEWYGMVWNGTEWYGNE